MKKVRETVQFSGGGQSRSDSSRKLAWIPRISCPVWDHTIDSPSPGRTNPFLRQALLRRNYRHSMLGRGSRIKPLGSDMSPPKLRTQIRAN